MPSRHLLGKFSSSQPANMDSKISAPLAVAIPAIAGIFISCIVLFCYKAFIDKINTPVSFMRETKI